MNPTSGDSRGRLTRDGIAQTAAHLRREFSLRYPAAALVAASDPTTVCEDMDDLELVMRPAPPPGACAVGGLYQPDRRPARITVGARGNRRDGFTVLHEVAHHLMYTDDEWSLRVRPNLPVGKERIAGEKVANAFAASILLPPEVVAGRFSDGVTATAIRDLFTSTEPSATACCVRGLDEPGERLVMLTRFEGRPWFADSHGTPFNPGRSLAQPLVAKAVERVGLSGSAKLTGGEGITYRTGRVDTDVVVEVAVEGGLVFTVATSTPHDTRLSSESGGELICGDCDEVYTTADSTRPCNTCNAWPCPACGRCDCERPAVFCEGCFIQLPELLARAGRTRCDDCS
jgi:hypothetical protein